MREANRIARLDLDAHTRDSEDKRTSATSTLATFASPPEAPRATAISEYLLQTPNSMAANSTPWRRPSPTYSLQTPNYARLIAGIYGEYNPDKLSTVPGLLAKNVGREHGLYERVCTRYLGQYVDPSVMMALVDMSGSVTGGVNPDTPAKKLEFEEFAMTPPRTLLPSQRLMFDPQRTGYIGDAIVSGHAPSEASCSVSSGQAMGVLPPQAASSAPAMAGAVEIPKTAAASAAPADRAVTSPAASTIAAGLAPAPTSEIGHSLSTGSVVGSSSRRVACRVEERRASIAARIAARKASLAAMAASRSDEGESSEGNVAARVAAIECRSPAPARDDVSALDAPIALYSMAVPAAEEDAPDDGEAVAGETADMPVDANTDVHADEAAPAEEEPPPAAGDEGLPVEGESAPPEDRALADEGQPDPGEWREDGHYPDDGYGWPGAEWEPPIQRVVHEVCVTFAGPLRNKHSGSVAVDWPGAEWGPPMLQHDDGTEPSGPGEANAEELWPSRDWQDSHQVSGESVLHWADE